MIQTTTVESEQEPWEGITTTESGAIVHLRKYLPRGKILQDLIQMELTPDNLAIIYTSVYLDTLIWDKEQKTAEEEKIIQ